MAGSSAYTRLDDDAMESQERPPSTDEPSHGIPVAVTSNPYGLDVGGVRTQGDTQRANGGAQQQQQQQQQQ
eukprot:CAMPEP_0198685540 /NCGR_PEP_ID=MMETSP1468-20131203/13779_1 /TAXON_ID=1461545 /ORGANISM="Mantoniella sp, Strain CCMP1436" /LENGTH=70 /DNA_ID=CAMNT_0044431085 /DNA_START=83 /DNA_END=292 /DNA_ORIENTATION=+